MSCVAGVLAIMAWLVAGTSIYCSTTGPLGIGYKPYESTFTVVGAIAAVVSIVGATAAVVSWARAPRPPTASRKPSLAFVAPAVLIAGLAAFTHWELYSACG